MTYATIAGVLLTAAGLGMIAFARQLAILYEGPNYTMSDLGFVVSGMMLAGAGLVVLLVTFLVRFVQKK